MSNPAFRSPLPEKPTQFEKDINELVEQLKAEVDRTYQYYTKVYPLQGLSWIYGTENQGMSLFISKANEILEKYSCNLKEDEPKNIHEAYQHFAQQANNKYSDTKNLATELAKWIHDCNRELGLVPKTGDLKLALTEIESLKNRLSDFKNLRQTRIFS
ncbi:hypothetical protein [Nostoc sp.]|uniref:hypothetical protein n=1 Tax=Nostoc sp. TaxID=1180 RepID=UPI003593988D